MEQVWTDSTPGRSRRDRKIVYLLTDSRKKSCMHEKVKVPNVWIIHSSWLHEYDQSKGKAGSASVTSVHLYEVIQRKFRWRPLLIQIVMLFILRFTDLNPQVCTIVCLTR